MWAEPQRRWAGGALAALALATVAPAAHASEFAVIYTVPSGKTLHPAIGAIRDGVIYGSDPTAGDGILFTLTTGGQNFAPLYAFAGSDGSGPNARLQVLGAGVFGTTQGGGAGAGTVFEVSTSGKLVWSHALQAATEGSGPRDGLAIGPAGMLYGTTSGGAISPGNGTLFRVSLAGHLGVVYLFRSTETDGHCPFTGVAIDTQGDVFGTTVGLGFGGQPLGAVWEMTPGKTPTVQYSFTNGRDGEYPMITPTLDAQGDLWGVSATNVAPGKGAVWMLSGTKLKVQFSFTGGPNGADPNGPLLLGHDGNLYGTTSAGALGLGTVFQITPQGKLTTLHKFTGGADGAQPTGGLATDAAGHIYGGTESGTIFRITP